MMMIIVIFMSIFFICLCIVRKHIAHIPVCKYSKGEVCSSHIWADQFCFITKCWSHRNSRLSSTISLAASSHMAHWIPPHLEPQNRCVQSMGFVRVRSFVFVLFFFPKAKYNQLMRIEEELGSACAYAGETWRKPTWMAWRSLETCWTVGASAPWPATW